MCGFLGCYNHLVIKKLNSFEMLSKKCANEMYSRLNVLVEEVNGLGLTQMSPSEIRGTQFKFTSW